MHRGLLGVTFCPSGTGPKFTDTSSMLTWSEIPFTFPLQAIASYLLFTLINVYGIGMWAHINVKLHFSGIWFVFAEAEAKITGPGRLIRLMKLIG